MMHGDAEVTVVVATYQRPDALTLALKSVQLQTFRGWRLLVIGDHCDAATADAMEAFRDDARIAFVNLPWRCGGQALPNSAGMAAARTEYVALLNHDDVWMPQHLEVAIGRLRSTGGDFFLGRAAVALDLEGDTSPRKPVFRVVSPVDRTLREAFWHHFLYVEPASAWVVRRAFAERVGPWRRADEIHRTSIVDWVLRAWRAGARLVQDDQITCLKIQTHWRSERARNYETPPEGQAWCVHAIERGEAQTIASGLVGLPGSRGTPMPARFRKAVPVDDERVIELGGYLLTPEMADLYFRSGLDAFDWLCVEAGIERGRRLRDDLRRRTGESLPAAPPLGDVVAYVTDTLDRCGAWSGA